MGAAEDVLYRLDPRKIRVLSGDIPLGYWELHGCVMERSSEIFKNSESAAAAASVNLDQAISKLDLKNVEDANPAANLVGIGVGAFAGLRFFGPIGAIGGAVLGQTLVGNRHEVNVDVHLSDGKQFCAVMDKSVYQRLKAIANRSE